MKIVRPATIDNAALTSTSATETVASYSALTTYALAGQARDDVGHRIYESLQASNTGHPLSDAAWWFDVGPSNQWAMFDTINGTSTTATGNLDVTVKPVGRIDSLGLLNVDAASVRIVATDTIDGVIYDQTFSMVEDSAVDDWYAYYYEPIVRKTDLIISDIPLYNTPSVRAILSASGNPTSVGSMVLGQAKTIGGTVYGASMGIVDYSRKTADDFGNYVLVERSFARKASFKIFMDGSLTDEVYRLLSGYRATPILYIGSDSYGSTAVFGFFRDFNVEIPYPSHSVCSLELEGLT